MKKSKERHLIRPNQGITLIALVITIIVLLILTGISIVGLMGNDGLLNKAFQAKKNTEIAQIKEEIELLLMEWKMGKKENIINFLNQKVEAKQLDQIVENSPEEGQIELFKKGYVVVIDYEGNIVQEITKKGPVPEISNLTITLEDGITVPEDKSLALGTKLKINFDISAQGAEIKSVTPERPYLTDGTTNKIEFTVVEEVEGEEYVRKVYVSVKEKYEAVYEAESLLDAMQKYDFEEENFKILANEELYPIHMYQFKESQVWDEDKIFGTEADVANNENDAKNMLVVKVNGDLTIENDVKVTAFANDYGGPKGMLIYCTGKLTNYGEISMTARGAKAEGQDVFLLKNTDGSYEYVPESGAVGGNAVGATTPNEGGKTNRVEGNPGETGTERRTGGGRIRICRSLSTEIRRVLLLLAQEMEQQVHHILVVLEVAMVMSERMAIVGLVETGNRR